MGFPLIQFPLYYQIKLIVQNTNLECAAIVQGQLFCDLVLLTEVLSDVGAREEGGAAVQADVAGGGQGVLVQRRRRGGRGVSVLRQQVLVQIQRGGALRITSEKGKRGHNIICLQSFLKISYSGQSVPMSGWSLFKWCRRFLLLARTKPHTAQMLPPAPGEMIFEWTDDAKCCFRA